MSFVTAALIAGGATLASTLIGSRAAGKAADVQSAAARSAAELQQQQYEQTRQDLAPWRAAGEQALNKLIPMTDYQKFGMAQFQQDPGYAFRLSEGQKALDRSAAARGGLISGGALKAAQRYGQDMGSQEYMNAFNRYQTERSAQLAPLQSLAGIGQTTAQQLGQAGQNYASSAGNLMTSGAAAQGAGYVGQANAITGGLGTYLNYSQNNALLNALRGGSGGGNYGTVVNPYFTPSGTPPGGI